MPEMGCGKGTSLPCPQPFGMEKDAEQWGGI